MRPVDRLAAGGSLAHRCGLGIDRPEEAGAGFGMKLGAEPVHPRFVVDALGERCRSTLPFGPLDALVGCEVVAETFQVPTELAGCRRCRGPCQLGVERVQGPSIAVVETSRHLRQRVGVLGADATLGELRSHCGEFLEDLVSPGSLLGSLAGAV